MVFITAVKRNSGDRLCCVLQPQSSTLQAQPADVLRECLAHHGSENAVEMERREVRNRSEIFERKIGIKMLLNVYEHAQQPLAVVDLSGGWFDLV